MQQFALVWRVASERMEWDDSTMELAWSGQAHCPPLPPIPCCFALYKQPVCSSQGTSPMTHPGSLDGGKVGAPIIALRVGRSFLPHQEAHQRPDRMVPDKAVEFGI